MSLECHNCGKEVTLEELHKVDSKMEELNEDQMEDLADTFSHCVGPPNHFHNFGEYVGMANCCWECFVAVTDFEFIPKGADIQ